jgi:hypothetical protein
MKAEGTVGAPPTCFSEVNAWTKSEVNATINTRSVNRARRRLWGEERRGQRDHQELRSVNHVRRRLCGEERK